MLNGVVAYSNTHQRVWYLASTASGYLDINYAKRHKNLATHFFSCDGAKTWISQPTLMAPTNKTTEALKVRQETYRKSLPNLYYSTQYKKPKLT